MSSKTKNKMTIAPPRKNFENDSLDKFINGAYEEIEASEKDNIEQNDLFKTYPWDRVSVRDDIKKLFNLRLPESYFLKLKHLAYVQNKSKQKICLDVLLPAIDDAISELE